MDKTDHDLNIFFALIFHEISLSVIVTFFHAYVVKCLNYLDKELHPGWTILIRAAFWLSKRSRNNIS